MMMESCSSSGYSSASSFVPFKSRKRAFNSPSSLPFKKLCVDPSDDYMTSIDESSQAASVYSASSRSRSVSMCSSNDTYHQSQTSQSESEEFEFIAEAEADYESSLSESSRSSSESATWTEHEEDGYSSEDFYAVDTYSDDEQDEPTMKFIAVTAMDATTEMARIRFPYISIRIKVSDFMCLGEGDFLNDTLIDFYLNHLVTNVIDEDMFRVHIFASMFWHRLRLSVFRADKTLSRRDRLRSQFRHARNYISQIGLFDNDFAIFPINELDHWSLAIVCNLESVIPEDYIIEGLTDDGQPLPRHNPCIVMFDPMNPEDEEQQKNLLKYGVIIRELLEYEYMNTISKGKDCSEKFSDEAFPIVFPKNVPTHTNFCDSGVYVLEYAENFLSNPPPLDKLACEGFDFKETYPKFNTKKKRADIQTVIMSFCKDKDKWQAILDYSDY